MYSVSVCIYGNRAGEGGEIYDEELAAEITEAESHHLPSACGRPWKASGIIKSEYKGLRTRGADDADPSLRVGEDEIDIQSVCLENRGQFLLQALKGLKKSEFAQSCPTFCYTMDYSLPSSSAMGFSRQ